ncbi:MAG: DUF547 domain-containing protein [Candidatus Cyclobacteriaceae bacterium M2_1C_046]
MRKILFLISFLFFASSVHANGELDKFFNDANSFLVKYVEDGRVAYEKINQNINHIQQLYDEIGSINLSDASEPERKAFYMNAYNLIVIYQVAKFYPLKSPMDQSGFFDKVKHKVAGEPMTLNYLEIKKIILPYKDARVHFGLACAAISCPPLSEKAFKPATVDQQLEILTKTALNDNNFIKVDPSNKKVAISKIFQWYNKDFTAEGRSIMDYINKYRAQKVPSSYEVVYYEYNWALNEG